VLGLSRYTRLEVIFSEVLEHLVHGTFLLGGVWSMSAVAELVSKVWLDGRSVMVKDEGKSTLFGCFLVK
jgi:hypothetical protein